MKRKPTFVSFSLSDTNGQYVNGVAIEVDRVGFHGFSDDGLLFDIYWQDGFAERRALNGQRYGSFEIGEQKGTVVSFLIQGEYPANRLITREEFHRMFGVERVCNALGHFTMAGR
jgi:hypothetical protein